ncbi:hypothetical protein BKA62DRAFT_332602 [Auriculariales sp. MPI-PUGE-AT-0066]|nr:hypothetical protein BKA62DRAFT_332602 [Auriculariales sp. MPI-PUGE-AT-0066]
MTSATAEPARNGTSCNLFFTHNARGTLTVMNASGRVEEAVSSLAWHESYEHSHEHPEIMQRMREHTEKAVHKLEESKGKGLLGGRADKLEAKHEAAAAKHEHEAAMKEYQKDVVPEMLAFEQSNDRKVAATRRHARDDGLEESPNIVGMTASEIDVRATPAFAGAPSRTRSIRRKDD